jgi:hypothetical protein
MDTQRCKAIFTWQKNKLKEVQEGLPILEKESPPSLNQEDPHLNTTPWNVA